ncbi:MAG: lipoate--protein ligase family protein [Deltaproteobacteria bacterium]|jgi:lipoate-protein ligase A|nr:lipoate--protein ligase family protein [Deltaproteobacteria bacterium]
MELFNLGKIPWEETQLIYHSLALLGREALCLVSPASPYVCIGYHQDLEQEVDLEFCRALNIPLFRREVGGGAVFLDGNQLFFHLILKRDNPIAPKRIDAFYQKFLKPVIDVHHRIGIQAEYKPVNDLIVQNRKISGTGAGEIGDSVVFVGNLILDFDYETMARVLKIPDEKFRDKVKKTITENLSTIRRELGEERAGQWDESSLNNMLAEEFEKLLGPLIPKAKDSLLADKMQALKLTMMRDDWLYRRGKHLNGRVVKIRSGLEVVQRMHKATGGLIRAEFFVEDGRFREVAISGDYFCFPKDTVSRLEASIEGSQIKSIAQVVTDFYQTGQFEWSGVEIDDWIYLFKI